MTDENKKGPSDTGRYIARELATFKSDVQSDIKGMNDRVKENTETVLKTHAASRRQIVHLTRMVSTLWKKVLGPTPPPPPPPPGDDTSFLDAAKDASANGGTKAIPEVLSEHDLDIAGIHGRLLTLESQNQELLKLQKEQMGKKDPNAEDDRGILTRLVDAIVWSVKEREGQKYTLMLIAGFTSLVTAMGTVYALMTGRLPVVTQPAAPPIYQYAPPPFPPPTQPSARSGE